MDYDNTSILDILMEGLREGDEDDLFRDFPDQGLSAEIPDDQVTYTTLGAATIPESHSPPLSVLSTGSGSVFTFPSPAPTPEATVPLAESLAQSPNIDISLFGPTQLSCFSPDDAKETVSTDAKNERVKEELAFHIRRRRRESGLGDIDVENETDKKSKNTLTQADLVRRERRKASNRRAATKCRQKKKVEEEKMQSDMDILRAENDRLKKEVETLTASKVALRDEYREHLAFCSFQCAQR